MSLIVLMCWLVQIVLTFFWCAIKTLFVFVWRLLYFVARKFMDLETNLNWFGVLMWTLNVAVNVRVFYITVIKDSKIASDDEKRALADEKAIWWVASQFLSFLGSSVSPKNEEHAEAIAAFKRELEGKNSYIRFMRNELSSLRKQQKTLEEKHTKIQIVNQQLETDNKVLQEEHKRAVRQLVLENETLKEELKRVKGGIVG